ESHASLWTTNSPADVGPEAGAAFVAGDLWVARTYQNQVAAETVPLPNPGNGTWNLALVRHRAPNFALAPTDVRSFGAAAQLLVYNLAPAAGEGFVLVGKLANGTLALGQQSVQAGAEPVIFIAGF